jgi:hypothetical protein
MQTLAGITILFLYSVCLLGLLNLVWKNLKD